MANTPSRQRAWQRKMKASGRCSRCGKKRPVTLADRCRICQDKHTAARKLRAYLGTQDPLRASKEQQP